MSREVAGRVWRAEEELRESEERLRALAEATFEGVALSEGGVVLEANDSFAALFGYEPSEVIGKDALEFMAPESHEKTRRNISADAEEPYEAVGIKKDGSRIDLEIRGKASSYMGRDVRLTAIRDVTRRKRAEAELRLLNRTLEERVAERTAELQKTLARLGQRERELRESEERLRVTFREASIGMAHVGTDGRWFDANSKLCEIVGYRREELLGLTFLEITHPDDREADAGYIRRMLRGEISSYSIEKRYLRRDRSRVWVKLSVSLVCGHHDDAPGEPSYFISVVEDITAEKLSELVPEALTPREIRVLSLIARAKTNRQIAEDLSYSRSTVKLHVQQILAKLGVPDRQSAAEKAVEIGLLRPPREGHHI